MKESDNSCKQYPPSADGIYAYLLKCIVNQEIEPGSKLVETKIAEKFNSSHTPVRTAIQRLIDDGFVKKISGRTAEVISPETGDFADVYMLYRELYKYASIQAAPLITSEQLDHLYELARTADRAIIGDNVLNKVNAELAFHFCLIDCAQNPYLSSLKQTIEYKLRYYTFAMYSKYGIKFESEIFLPTSHILLCNNLHELKRSGKLRLFELAVSHHCESFPVTECDWKRERGSCKADTSFKWDRLIELVNSESYRGLANYEEYNQLLEKNPFLSISEAIYTILLRSIIIGRISCNENISISSIATLLKVSRNPVREALQRLKDEGYVCKTQHNDIRVRELTDSEMNNINYARLALETAAAYLAARNASAAEQRLFKQLSDSFSDAVENGNYDECTIIDGAFHAKIVMASHNSYIKDAYELIFPFIRMRVWQATQIRNSNADIWQTVRFDHERIRRLLSFHNSEDAAAAMRLHLQNLELQKDRQSKPY